MSDIEPHEWQPYLAPHAPLAEIRPFTVGHVLSLTLRLFGTHLWLITKIVFLVVTPVEILKVMSLTPLPHDWQTTWLPLLMSLIFNVLIAPALIYAVMKDLETGFAPGVNESFRWGLTRIGRLAVCAAISWVLQGLGYMLCFIPGIIVSMSLALVYPVAILEKGSLADVFRRSNELTRGYRWEIFGAEGVLGVLILIVTAPAAFLLGNAGSVGLSIFVAVLKDIAEQAATVLSLMLYLTLLRTPRQGSSMLHLTN